MHFQKYVIKLLSNILHISISNIIDCTIQNLRLWSPFPAYDKKAFSPSNELWIEKIDPATKEVTWEPNCNCHGFNRWNTERAAAWNFVSNKAKFPGYAMCVINPYWFCVCLQWWIDELKTKSEFEAELQQNEANPRAWWFHPNYRWLILKIRGVAKQSRSLLDREPEINFDLL